MKIKTPIDTDNTSGSDCPEATCYAFDSPEGELRHMLEVAHANGFRSITDAITMARKYRETLRRLQDAVVARMIPDDPTGSKRLELLRASDAAREILGRNARSDSR